MVYSISEKIAKYFFQLIVVEPAKHIAFKARRLH